MECSFVFSGVDCNTRTVVHCAVPWSLFNRSLENHAVEELTRLVSVNFPCVVWVVEASVTGNHRLPEGTVTVRGCCRECWQSVPESYDGEPLFDEEPFPSTWEDVPCHFHSD